MILGLFTILMSVVLADYDYSCNQGWYLKDGYVCNICEPGKYCQGGSRRFPGDCPSGTYSNFGASECTICPAGFYCQTPASIPTRCPVNQGSYQGSTSCQTCQNGQYCTWDGLIEPCPKGYFCNSAQPQRIPRLCRAGYWCDGKTENACAAGSWSEMGALACTAIEPGQYMVSSSQKPADCPEGYYQAFYGTTNPCYECQKGFECPDTKKEPSACKPGYYAPLTGMLACLICPAGYYCTNTNTNDYFPQECDDGWYSQDGWQKCAPCPAGYQCPYKTMPNNGGSADMCPTGYYSKAEDGFCTVSPAGYYHANNPTIAPVKCQVGYYSQPGDDKCTICPSGKMCPDPTYLPILCKDGTWSGPTTGSTMCIPCPRGSTCTNGIVTACAAGEISEPKANICMKCPAGYACPLLSFEYIVPCGPGYYSIEGATACTVSPAGSYAATTQAVPTVITGRYYAEIGFTYQTRCPPGWNCLDKTGRHNVVCKPNQYSHATNGCTTCPAGTFCPAHYAQVSFFTTTGLACDVGTWAGEGSNECEVCPPGYDCSVQTAVPVECASGKYQIGGSATCTDCPVNHECSSKETVTPCPPYFYSSLGGGHCQYCPTGKDCNLINRSTHPDCGKGLFRGEGDIRCENCPRGHYCPNNQNDKPTICPAGKYSNEAEEVCATCPADYYSDAGSEYCTPVPPGFSSASQGAITKCAHKTYSDWGDQTCKSCPNGYLCPEKTGYGYATELSCPRGSYCIAGVQTLCPAGYYGVKERGISQADACALCPPGYNCVAGTEDFLLAPCPLGAYCKGGDLIAMIACPSGYTTHDMYARSLADCVSCAAGQSCGNAVAGTTTTSSKCEQGYVCPIGGAYRQYPCPAGTFGGYRTGKQDISECLQCPPGYYCASATVTPTAIPAGYYSPLPGLDALASAHQCPPKFYCPNTAMTTFKGYPCAAGYYCPAGTTSATQYPCPVGTYSDRTDLWNQNQCTVCPKGFSCASGIQSTATQPCPQHSYCPYGTPSTNIPQCPAGTYAPYTQSMSLSDCIPCPAGSYCLQGAGSTVCPAGYFCPSGTRLANQNPCPQGTYSVATGLIDSTQCMACGVGKYCPTQAMSAPLSCSAGTYNDFDVKAIMCTICPQGYSCTSVDVHPVLCPKGTYSDFGQNTTPCPNCPAGSYCPLPGTTKDQMDAQKCPAGTLCLRTVLGQGVGLDTYPNLLAAANQGNACPPNFYCPRGTPSAIAIPPGTTQLLYGAGYADQAVQTPAGYNDPTLASGCPAGHYCPQGTATTTPSATYDYINNAIPCPKGYYRGNAYGKDVSDCGLCPAGYFCGSAGTVTPVICTIGHYCPEGTAVPVPCPEGTYNTGTGLTDSKSCKACDAGFYCQFRGMTSLDTSSSSPVKCDPGFICYQGANRPEPTDQVTGDICRAGAYCPQGVSTPTLCSPGYLGIFQAASLSSACVKCYPGYYCKGSGSTGTSNQCPAGYYCPEGTIDYTQTPAMPAPAGEYTTIGLDLSLKCPLGEYNTISTQQACQKCDQGYFCNTIGLVDPNTASKCPAGYYCPSYTTVVNAPGSAGYRMMPCPIGTYLDLTQKTSETDCIPCPATFACETTAIAVIPSAANMKCAAGFFCKQGSPSRYPLTLVNTGTAHYGPCPAGYFCPIGTGDYTTNPCPTGTYSNQVGAIDNTWCLPCPPGYLCATTGLKNPVTLVPAGTLTTDKIASVPYAASSTGMYAPLGAFVGLRCPTGMYQNTANSGYCNYCQSGQYCMIGQQINCPQGYWCP